MLDRLLVGAVSVARDLGVEVRRVRRTYPPDRPDVSVPAVVGVHYACGDRLEPRWLNVDEATPRAGVPAGVEFVGANLVQRHPFADASFALAYAEDFLEHLSQADSLLFLAEAYRVLRPGGTLRLSFPGLELVFGSAGPRDLSAVREGVWGAFEKWGHVHFYARDELRAVARYIGFTRVAFHAFRASPIPELAAMDSRPEQAHQNTYAELTR